MWLGCSRKCSRITPDARQERQSFVGFENVCKLGLLGLLPALLDVLAQISDVRQLLAEGYLKEKLGSAEHTLSFWSLISEAC